MEVLDINPGELMRALDVNKRAAYGPPMPVWYCPGELVCGYVSPGEAFKLSMQEYKGWGG